MPFTVTPIEELKPHIEELKSTDKFDVLIVLLVVLALFIFRGLALLLFKFFGFLIIAVTLYILIL
jgi:hypothetical protein